MRQFKVGDKVRFGVDYSGDPVWSFSEKKRPHAGYATATVDILDDYGLYFLTYWVDDQGFECAWTWPQPGTKLARYGEPGYLELVKGE